MLVMNNKRYASLAAAYHITSVAIATSTLKGGEIYEEKEKKVKDFPRRRV